MAIQYEDEATPEEFAKYKSMFFEQLNKVGVPNRDQIPRLRMYAEMCAMRWTIYPWWLVEVNDEDCSPMSEERKKYEKDVAKIRRRMQWIIRKYGDY